MSADSADQPRSLNAALERFSQATTRWAGSSWAFALAICIVLMWAFTGPMFEFSERWLLFINTGSTIVTLLMVFLIQRSQNKDSKAVQLKLNELLAAQRGASNRLINAEDLSEAEIRALHQRFSKLAEQLAASGDHGAARSVEDAERADGADKVTS
jgi:low affinity Fe/Cu permease